MSTNFAEQFKQQIDGEPFKTTFGSLPDDLWGLSPSFTKEVFSNLLTEIMDLLKAADETLMDDPVFPLVPRKLTITVSNISGNVGSGDFFFQNIVWPLLELKEQIERALATSVPDAKALKEKLKHVRLLQKESQKLEGIISAANEELAEVTKIKTNFEGVNDAVTSAQTNLKTIQEKVEEIVKAINAANAKATELVFSNGSDNDQSVETTVSKAKECEDAAAEASKNAISHEKDAKEKIKSAVTLQNEINIAFKDNLALKTQVEELNNQANSMLENVARTGLSGAFRNQKIELENSARLWMIFLTVIVLITASYALFFFLPDLPKILNGTTGSVADWVMITVRFAIFGPLVWLAYFLAKQFSYVQKMRYDYVAKTTSALAFEGYKSEVVSDPVLLHQLLEVSVKRFGEHPVRFYEDNQPADKSDGSQSVSHSSTSEGQGPLHIVSSQDKELIAGE